MKKIYLLLLLIVSIPALAQKGAVRAFSSTALPRSAAPSMMPPYR
jgi:hypothetical protein